MVLDRQSIYLFYLCGEGGGESQTRACLGWRLNRFISLERVGERDHVCQLLPQDGAQGGTPLPSLQAYLFEYRGGPVGGRLLPIKYN
jgi:hypothetical protein